MRKVLNPKKNDILLVGSYPPPFGGQSVHIQSLHSHLKDNDFSVTILNTGVNKLIGTREIISIKSSGDLLISLLFKYNTRLLHLHVANFEDLGKLIPVFAAAIFKKFIWVLTIHSGNIDLTLNNGTSVRKFLIKSMLSRVDKVICVNDTIRDILSKWIHCEKLVVIPAFYFNFVEKKTSEEIETFLNTHDPVISCVGFYEPVYGFDLALLSIKELMKNYKKIGLIIMGDKKGESPRYETMIHEHRLSNHVFLAGNMDHDECLSVIKRSALFLRPTLFDGDSISVREALAMNVPVVASNTEFRPVGVDVFNGRNLEDMVKKMVLRLGSNVCRSGCTNSDLSNVEKIRRAYTTLMEPGR